MKQFEFDKIGDKNCLKLLQKISLTQNIKLKNMKTKGNYLAGKSLKVAILFLLLFVVYRSANAQVSSYSFTQAAGSPTYLTAGYTSHTTGTTDYGTYLNIPIGFTFAFNCVDYTTVNISNDGWISFGAALNNSYYPLSTGTTNNVISALGGDLQGLTTGSLRSKTQGTAPNRTFTVEWQHYKIYGEADDYSFQIVLTETTNTIKIYYATTTAVSGSTFQVGLRGATSSDYNNRTKASNTGWISSSAGTANTNLMTSGTAAKSPTGIFTWTPTVPYCTGTPSAGTASASPTSVCSGTPTNLTLTGGSTGCGISYQWQSASAIGGPYTNITGANTNPYSVSPTAVTYYRCVSTCSNGGGTNTSSVATVSMNAPLACYCISAATSTSDMDITNITFGSINNTSATVSLTGSQGTAVGTAGMYSDWRGSAVPVPSVQQGSTVSFQVIVGGTAYSHRVVVYFDFNQDGDFTDAGEDFPVFAYANPTLPNTTTYSIPIPLSATTGNTIMRVVCVESSTANPCGTYTWGETEDYSINITAAPACTGVPVGGTATASTLAGCGNTGAISVTGSTAATGLTYQWYSSPAAGGPWTLIPGATSETYTPATFGLYYRRTVTCPTFGSANSTSLQYTSSSPINDECVNATTITVNADNLCTITSSGTVACASASAQSNGCSGTSDDDVWYKFVATGTTQNISLKNVAGSVTDMYFVLYSGSCGSLTQMLCSDNDAASVSGLTIGATYYIRVYTYTSTVGQTTTFDVCVSTPSPTALCSGAEPFCSGTSYNFPAGVGSGTGEVGPNYGCLSSTPNPVWYYLKVATSGPIELHINGSNSYDVDFACWGPFADPDAACTGQLTSSSTVSHHATGASTDYPSLNMIDCSFNASFEEWCYIPNAVAGEYYILLLTNYSNSAQNMVFSQTTGTGSTDCSIVAPPVTNNGPLCVGQTLQLTVTSPVAGATYAWTGPNGFTSTTMNPSIAGITLAGAGTYSLVITVGGVSSAPVTTTVVVYANPTASITNNSGTTILTCTTTSINVTAASGTTYAWSGGTTPTTATNSFTTPGTYVVTVTNGGICTSTASIVITQNITPPTVGITNNTGSTVLTCALTSISVTATPAGATSYSWSGGATTTTANNSFTTPGTYTVTVTAANGCTATSSITLTQNNTPPTVGITNNSGGATVLTCALTSISVTATPAGATSYAWSGGATTTTSNNSFTTPGTYTVTVTAANGCTATSSITLTQNNTPPTVGITNNSGGATELTCALTSISVTATPAGATSYAWSGGATTTTANNNFTAPGTYTVTVTAANGCTATSSITITQDATVTSANITNNSGSTVLTCTLTSISVTATPAGATSYAWSGGATTTTANNSFTTPGTYTVTVTAANGCTGTSSITLTQNNTPPTVGITNNSGGATELTCTLTSISVTATPAGATSYAWSGGATTTTANNSFTTPGTYTVTVTAANGCTATSSITLTQNNTLPTVGITNNSGGATEITCVITSISVTATPAGATSYAWSGGATPTTANNNFTSAATYTVTVTAANGCTATSSINITQDASVISANITNNTGSTVLTCTTTSISVTATPAGATSYAWSGGATTTTANNSFTTPGTYSVTVTAANGCTSTSSITLTQNITPPVVGITNNSGGATELTCALTTISVTATPAGATSYAWSGGATTTTANNSFTTPGTYTVTVTAANGCNATSSITLTQNNTPPTVGITNNSGTTIITCTTPSISVTATPAGATSYAWSGGATPTTVNNNFTTPGTYTVTVTAANGCTATSSISLTQNTTPPVVGISNNSGTTVLTCLVTSINVTATPAGATSYAWSGGATPATATNNFTAPGTYTVTVTNPNGCTSTSSVTITQSNTPPLVTINNNSAGETQLTCLLTQINVTATGGGTYVWSGGNSTTTAGNSFTSPATYTVTVTAPNGCTATSAIAITQNTTTPTVAITNNSASSELTCSLTQINVTASGGGTYAWSGGATTTSANNSFTQPGTYTVTVTSANGCTSTSSIAITQNTTLPVPVITNNTGISILDCIHNVINVTASGGVTYVWSGGTTPSTDANSFTTPGTYSVTVTGSNGCTAVSDIVITQDAPVVLSSNGTVSDHCGKGMGQASVSTTGGSGVYNYTWNTTPTQNGPIATQLIAGTYQVIVSDGRCSDTIAMTVGNIAGPVAVFEPIPSIATSNNPLIRFQNSSTGGTSYSWIFGDGAVSIEEDPSHLYTESGQFDVVLYVVDDFGCIDSVSHPVKIIDDLNIFIPNSFTPNGDGKNDVFRPYGRGYDLSGYEMNIYDRWGQLIFFSSEFDKGWDGKIKGDKLDINSLYVYRIVIYDLKGKDHVYTGHVTILGSKQQGEN